MNSPDVERAAERRMPLTSIERPGVRVSVHHRHGDVEVVMVEIGREASISEPILWGSSSWHLVVEGQAVFHQGEHDWEVLPEQSLRLVEGPYTIANPSPERLRVLSVISAADPDSGTAGVAAGVGVTDSEISFQ